MTSSTERCDFCGGDLQTLYRPEESPRKASVCVCGECGLVQSIYEERSLPDKLRSLSSGAQWGNIRHGKRLRMQQLAPFLEGALKEVEISTALDVGSNRGDFVIWLRNTHPACKITAIEPDASLIGEYRSVPDMLHADRLENITLPDAHFDLIHCCHTLEHADSAAQMIRAMHGALKPGGRLFIEVPDLESLSQPLTVEEFFIDKHAFHFSRKVLCDFLIASGFTLLEQPDTGPHITLMARRDFAPLNPARLPPDPASAAGARRLVRDYVENLTQNRERLKTAASRLKALADRQRIGFWGGGRLFDALVRFGGFDPPRDVLLIDQYLAGLASHHHGIPIQRPEALKTSGVQVLVVLARNSSAEIVASARRFGVKNIIRFDDLMPQ